MLKKERQNFILHQIKIHNRVLSSDLSQSINVSEDTIRRDLQELAVGGRPPRLALRARERRGEEPRGACLHVEGLADNPGGRSTRDEAVGVTLPTIRGGGGSSGSGGSSQGRYLGAVGGGVSRGAQLPQLLPVAVEDVASGNLLECG